MSYYLYVIRSGENNYIGTTKNVRERLAEHNSGKNRSTKFRRDWKLVYFETYATLSKAREAERRIKNSKIGINKNIRVGA